MTNDENPAPPDEPKNDPPAQQVATPQKAPMQTGGRVQALIPRSSAEVMRIAAIAVDSGRLPRDIKTDKAAAMAIMHGAEIGLPPMMALQKIAMINGRPTLWGDAIPAVAITTGQLEGWKEWVEGEGEAMVAHCVVKRRMPGTGAVIEMEATYSAREAIEAGLWQTQPMVERWVWKEDGSKGKERKTVPNDSPWYRFKRRMLVMRARVAFRDLFSDAYSGLYVSEEMVGPNTDAEMRDITPAPYERIANPLGDDDEVPPRDVNADMPPEEPQDALASGSAPETPPAPQTAPATAAGTGRAR